MSIFLIQLFTNWQDALIVCSMVWVAWKNRHTFSHTQRVFLGWVELAFETNAITFILCLATAIAYGAKAPYYGAPFSFVCVKIYDLTLSTYQLLFILDLSVKACPAHREPFSDNTSCARGTSNGIAQLQDSNWIIPL